GEATRPGREASRSSSSARPTSARIRAKMSMASATGGFTRGVAVVRTLWQAEGRYSGLRTFYRPRQQLLRRGAMVRPVRLVLSLGLALALSAVASAQGGSTRGTADCTKTSVGLTPLTELGSGTYEGYRGGLYPGG